MSDPDFVIPFDRLPEKLAERIEDPPADPVTPRPAATIVLLRDGPDGMEVLLMRRNRSAGFVPGAYVFPGGRVDGSDTAPPAMDILDGLTTRGAAERLDLIDAEPPAIAYYLAALREAFEETGILVGFRSDGSAPPTAAEDPTVDAIRNDVMEDRVTFAGAVSRMRCRIAGDAVEYLAHWITPTPEPRRYDTRFFAARVRDAATPIVDPREMTEALWSTPTRALDRVDDGSLPMIFPTIKTLEQLAPFANVGEALDVIRRGRVRSITPTLVITPQGVGMRLDDDSSSSSNVRRPD